MPELTGQASAAYLALRNDELQSLSRDRYGLTWSALSDAQKAVVQQAAGITGSISAPQGPLGDLSKIIRDGRIEVVVGNGEFERKLATVTRIANSNGGFVLTSSTRDQKSGTLTLRIPDNRFDVAMEQLRRLGEVKADEVTGQDVTAEFVDNRARLDILLGRRALLRRLQNDATTSSEILRLAGLIERTQLEIERIQGSLNFIRDEVAEATIKVELREKDAPVAEQQQQENVDQPSLGNSVELGVQGFMRVVGAVVVGLGYLIPVGAIAVVIWAVVMVVRCRSRVAS